MQALHDNNDDNDSDSDDNKDNNDNPDMCQSRVSSAAEVSVVVVVVVVSSSCANSSCHAIGSYRSPPTPTAKDDPELRSHHPQSFLFIQSFLSSSS